MNTIYDLTELLYMYVYVFFVFVLTADQTKLHKNSERSMLHSDREFNGHLYTTFCCLYYPLFQTADQTNFHLNSGVNKLHLDLVHEHDTHVWVYYFPEWLIGCSDDPRQVPTKWKQNRNDCDLCRGLRCSHDDTTNNLPGYTSTLRPWEVVVYHFTSTCLGGHFSR